MLYFTRHLRARAPLTYFGQELKPGDEFQATGVDADYLTRAGRADDYQPATEPVTAPEVVAKRSDGLTVAQIKAALAELNISIPDGLTLKADLAALLDGAP